MAEGVFGVVRASWPTPARLALADGGALVDVVRPLGFQNGRARSLKAYAAAWLALPPATRADVLALPGCGAYAADSWAVFVEGLRDVAPLDGKLNWFLDEEARRAVRP